jgi:hypothetical protein
MRLGSVGFALGRITENSAQARRLRALVSHCILLLVCLPCTVLGVGLLGYEIGYEDGRLAERGKGTEVLAR